MSDAAFFTAIASKEKVDAGAGIISGVSVITEGEAQGKNAGTWIDRTTLTQIADVAGKYPDGVKVKLSQAKEHDGSVGQVVGCLKGFRVDGNRVRADLHLLKSDENFSKILEMAQTMPAEFGLSVVIPKDLEKQGDKHFLRCSEIYSIDLVEAPAANPTGLFSKGNDMKDIKYAKGTDGDHAKDCECKECMSKHSKKSMSALLAVALGKAEDAPEADIVAELTKRLEAAKPVDLSKVQQDIEKANAELTRLTTAATEAAKLSKQMEIAGLTAEASRAGKVIPLTDAQLAKMDVADIKEMFSKLTPGQVSTSKKTPEFPKNKDGVKLSRTSAEFVEFCRSKQEEGAAALSAQFAATPGLN